MFSHISTSVDGFINDRDGDDSFFPIDGSFMAHIDSMLAGIGGMVFGRRAFDQLATFWPKAGEMGDAGLARQAEPMNRLPKYVLTHRPLETAWAASQAVTVDELRSIKAEATAPIAVFAGADAISSVLEAGLLDQFRLLRQPVILGEGIPLFARNSKHRCLKLLKADVLATGAILETYEVDNVSQPDTRP
ncbi:MAG: dihydrofolate reductase family protein [Tabrizicola sp.]